MASPPPPGVTSPPASTPLALPRQRPSLALPPSFKGRNPSAVSTPSGLRQTSYPPEDSFSSQNSRGQRQREQFSPVDDDSIGDLSDDGDIKSALGAPGAGTTDDDGNTSRKRKRGEKRSRGRPPKQSYTGGFRQSSASVVNGDDGGGKSSTPSRRGTTAGAGSAVNGEGEDEEDDEDETAGRDAKDGFNIDKEELEKERERRFLFREAVHAEHQNRYDSFNRVKLKQADVRRLVNATLSQSVPQNVVTVVMAYTKMFAGMLIEGAREVQDEWLAAEEKRPDGELARAYKRLRMMQPGSGEEGAEEEDGVMAEAGDAAVESTEEKKDEDGGLGLTKPVAVKEEPADTAMTIKKEADDDESQAALKIADVPKDPPAAAASSMASTSSEDTPMPDIDSSGGDTQPNTSPATTQTTLKDEPSSSLTKESQTSSSTLPSSLSTTTTKPKTNGTEKNPDDDDEVTSALHVQPGAANLGKYIEDVDRGPLLPDHFREALRRYRKARGGGTVGFTGLSLEGRENAAVKSGGRKLFR